MNHHVNKQQPVSSMARTFSVGKVGFIIVLALFLFTVCDSVKGPTSPKPDYTLQDGEYFRVLSPNGGERIAYGDTMKVEWIMNATKAFETVVEIIKLGDEVCQYNGSSSTEWFKWPRDKGVNGVKTMHLVDSVNNIVYGSMKILVKDTILDDAGCSAIFGGDSMKVHVYDPYGDERDCEQCYEGDYSDNLFSVIGKEP